MNSLFLLVAVAVGLGVGYMVRKLQATAKIGTAETRAEKVLEEAKQKEKEIILSAKDQAIKLTEEAKKQETEIRQQILRIESRLEKKENDLDKKVQDMDSQKQSLEKQSEDAKKIREELTANRDKQIESLEKIAKLTRDEAKTVLLEQTEKLVKDDMLGLTRKMVASARENAEREARDVIAQAIERVSAEVSAESTTSTVTLPNEDMKGRIIGK